ALREVERERLLARERLFLPDERSERGPRREEQAEEREHHPAVHPIPVLPEPRRAVPGRCDPDRERRDRHGNADGRDLEHPARRPRRQAPRPDLEDAEHEDADERERRGAEEERREAGRPGPAEEERDRERQPEGDEEPAPALGDQGRGGYSFRTSCTISRAL